MRTLSKTTGKRVVSGTRNILLNSRISYLLPSKQVGIAVLTHRPHDQSLYNKAGTLLYMASEQLLREPCLTSYQYALSIVVYEWLCSRCPFRGSSARERRLISKFTDMYW